jgi:hypothetical protein
VASKLSFAQASDITSLAEAPYVLPKEDTYGQHKDHR